jgi:hypothetical protein
MGDSPSAYPLAWPAGWPRTASRQRGTYRTELPTALKNLNKELSALCGPRAAATLVLSSNVTLGRQQPPDPGVVAYLTWDGQQIAIPCDRWMTVAHNVQAIALTIEAMRAMERHGAKHMIKAMFQGFTAIRGPGPKPWREIMGIAIDSPVTRDQINERFRLLARSHHPDVGGSEARMAEINAARDAGLREIGADG